MSGIDADDGRHDSPRQDRAVPASDSEVWLALAAARMGIWEWDLNSGAVRWSTATALAHGLTPETAPMTGRAALELVHPDDRQHHQEACDRAIRDGTELFAEYRIVAADAVHWVQSRGRVTYDAAGKPCRLLGVNIDISEQKLLEDKLLQANQMRALTGRLMRAQDDERRRIAQMLHETTAQNLAGLKMLLARLNRTSARLSDDERSALAESMSLAEQSMTEVRTLSYLLHPPFLDEAGLISALRWYAAGFAGRSGIDVGLELPENFERLARDTETALFRIVQESLINIHRHAGSRTANIRLQRDAETLVLEVDDQGHGIPNASLERIMRGGRQRRRGHRRHERTHGAARRKSRDHVQRSGDDRPGAVTAGEGRRLMALRILVVDDHAVVRRGVRSLLESHEGWEVCGEAINGRDAVEQSRQLRPDVVVMDLSLPELNGLDATRQILKDGPGIEVLVLTMHHSEELARDVLRAGARGYIMKSDADENLITAVDRLREHKPFLTSTVTAFVLDDFVRRRDGGQGDLSLADVTSREREVIQLVAEGRNNKEAASRLGISVKTIEAHRANIMRKLQLRTVSDLVRYAIRNNIVQP